MAVPFFMEVVTILKYLFYLLFASSAGVLITGKFGVLTIPGIIMALLGIYFARKQEHVTVATIGVLTATGSYMAQSFTYYCYTCTLAATLFAIAGILALIQDRAEHYKVTIGLIVLLCLGLFSLNSMFQFYQNPVIQDEPYIAQAVEQSDKPLLYVSPTCKACTSMLEKVLAYDSNGEKCLVVVTPIRALASVETELKNRGYTGEVISASQSPTGFVPVLIKDGEVLRGSQIENYLKGEI